MDMENNTKGAAENNAYVLELEKRLGDVEAALQNISRGFQSGNFAPEQEGRLVAVEDRLENTEDLQMVANLDMIKLKEIVEKIPAVAAQPSFIAGANASGLERRVNDIESTLKRIGGGSPAAEPQKSAGAQPSAGRQDFQDARNETARLKADVATVKDEMIRMKNEFSSFRGETEEVVKVMISSIKRLSEVLK